MQFDCWALNDFWQSAEEAETELLKLKHFEQKLKLAR